MGTAASALLDPISAELDVVGRQRTAKELSRRATQRRQIQAMVGVSYVIDALILLIYSEAGVIPASIGPAYAAIGLLTVACNVVLSETGVTERFKDHYFVGQQSIVGMAISLAFVYVAPQVGVLFLCTLFIIFNFASLRSTPRQTAVVWTIMTLGLAGLFLMTDKPISMPYGTPLERFATMSVFALTIGRCMFLGIFSSSMRQSLYNSGLKLKEAYRRIEELAELDELTGSYNRRCIMRMLDEEITRARRTGAPCSIALIDLDWFKRINDSLWPSDRRRSAADVRHHHLRQHPRHRPVRPLRRRGIPAGAAGYRGRGRRTDTRTAAPDHFRSRLERVLARHAGDDFSGRHRPAPGRDAGHISRARRQRALFSQGTGTQPDRVCLIPSFRVPGTEKPSPA